MDCDVAVNVEHVSKKYCKSLKRSMLYGLEDIGRNLVGLNSHSEKLRKNEFWAVDDVSFEVKKGESLGLIGPNGSGKSTLLKMLNGIFWPDKGKITVKGRVGALIEVGAGFHPLLTGRENIYVNAAILGMTKEEVDAKFDDIVEFADIGDFIDAPVKSYSSGMFVRLGFAVAAHCEPDILLVDEVLAVGDINFQIRCLRHITKMMDRCAVILVSQSPNLIRFNCQKVLFLNNGKTQFLGLSSQGVDAYDDYMMRQRLSENSAGKESKFDPKVELNSVDLFDKNYNKITEVDAGGSLIIEGSFTVVKPIREAIVGVQFWLDCLERSFVCYSSQVSGGQYYDLARGEHKFRITIPKISLKAGMYNIGVRISEKKELAEHALNISKYILVKNPYPDFGLYSMKLKFDMDKKRAHQT
jgi:lipopolysaccharide transport system ATP-binding protein